MRLLRRTWLAGGFALVGVLAFATSALATPDLWMTGSPTTDGLGSMPMVAVDPLGLRTYVLSDIPTVSPFSSSDTQLAAYSAATGAPAWSVVEPLNHGTDFIVGPDGQMVYTSYATPAFSAAFIVANDASTGEEEWRTPSAGFPASITLSPDGSTVYVSSDQDRTIRALDATDGSKVWDSVGPIEAFSGMAAALDGSALFAIGEVPPNGRPPTALAVSPVTGDQLWKHKFQPFAQASCLPSNIAVSGQTVYFTVRDCRSGSRAFAIIAVDGVNGAMKWIRTHGGSPNQVIAAKGSVCVVGGGGNFLTVCYKSSNGKLIWQRKVAWEKGQENIDTEWDEARAATLSPDSAKLFVTGIADAGSWNDWGPADADYGTIAYALSTGRELWRTRHDGPVHSEDVATGVAASNEAVFVTGASAVRTPPDHAACDFDDTACDAVTIAYPSD